MMRENLKRLFMGTLLLAIGVIASTALSNMNNVVLLQNKPKEIELLAAEDDESQGADIIVADENTNTTVENETASTASDQQSNLQPTEMKYQVIIKATGVYSGGKAIAIDADTIIVNQYATYVGNITKYNGWIYRGHRINGGTELEGFPTLTNIRANNTIEYIYIREDDSSVSTKSDISGTTELAMGESGIDELAMGEPEIDELAMGDLDEDYINQVPLARSQLEPNIKPEVVEVEEKTDLMTEIMAKAPIILPIGFGLLVLILILERKKVTVTVKYLDEECNSLTEDIVEKNKTLKSKYDVEKLDFEDKKLAEVVIDGEDKSVEYLLKEKIRIKLNNPQGSVIVFKYEDTKEDEPDINQELKELYDQVEV